MTHPLGRTGVAGFAARAGALLVAVVNYAWANRGGREAIEVFDVVMRTRRPRLTWRVCLPLPPGQGANSVCVFADGTVLATVLARPGTAIADFVTGRVTGAVWQWRIVATDFMPDNIHWSAGRLLVGEAAG
ncbi:MAG: hypothetical protein H7267_05455 [Sandarakinorhabdus sp.]|nr:hypothetical protein [Sandarakinorhabdus sp.]